MRKKNCLNIFLKSHPLTLSLPHPCSSHLMLFSLSSNTAHIIESFKLKSTFKNDSSFNLDDLLKNGRHTLCGKKTRLESVSDLDQHTAEMTCTKYHAFITK